MVWTKKMMFRDHPDKDEYIWERLPEWALEDKLHKYRNLCKRNHEESLKLYCTVPYPVFYSALALKKCFCFYGEVLSLNCSKLCYFFLGKLHRYKYFKVTPTLCLINLSTQSKSWHHLPWDWHLPSPSSPSTEPPITSVWLREHVRSKCWDLDASLGTSGYLKQPAKSQSTEYN